MLGWEGRGKLVSQVAKVQGTYRASTESYSLKIRQAAKGLTLNSLKGSLMYWGIIEGP
jgi:hypothetical protein